VSGRRAASADGHMLELWRPPQGAGEPVGCLSTTYTFSPGLFAEECLARFLDIESEPNRESLAFLLERESRLGSVYAGVLVDRTQAGVEHSLRWDVLPVRVRAGKQHAKLTLLAWNRLIRLIVASANLTQAGYRLNYEVAVNVDLGPEQHEPEMLADALGFVERLIRLVPGGAERPEVERAREFLNQLRRLSRGWKAPSKSKSTRRKLIFTLPSAGGGATGSSSLTDAFEACRKRGASPDRVLVASPFFDVDDEGATTAALCKAMSRVKVRDLTLCVPAVRDGLKQAAPRLAAPKALLTTAEAYCGAIVVAMLPETDPDRNVRIWHAKLLGLRADEYSALMVGSSNFTRAGMGLGNARNCEANLLTIVDRVAYAREVGELESVWPDVEKVDAPNKAEWLGAQGDKDEEEQDGPPCLPAGFVSATYLAGDHRSIRLRLDPDELPPDWEISACGKEAQSLLVSAVWVERGRPESVEIPWQPAHAPEKLLVKWAEGEAFLALNVQDAGALPPLEQLEQMTAEDMLGILAASDPSAAFRVWSKRNTPGGEDDDVLDSAQPIDLDPLRRFDLQATFLHRIRRRARILAQLRANLQRPVWGRQSLDWRLRGMVGIEPLADRFLKDFVDGKPSHNEALLSLADFLIVLREVEYVAQEGYIAKADFDAQFRPFLKELSARLDGEVARSGKDVPHEFGAFWKRVVERCQA
jgi:hypothetical protein